MAAAAAAAAARQQRDGRGGGRGGGATTAADARQEAIRLAQLAWQRRTPDEPFTLTDDGGFSKPAAAGGGADDEAGGKRGATAAAAAAAASAAFCAIEEEAAAGGDGLRLSVFGDAGVDTHERPERLAKVTSVSLKWLSYDRIVASYLPRLAALRRLRELTLSGNDLHSLAQLNALAILPQLTSVVVGGEGNTATALPHFRSRLIALLPHLKQLNGEVVADDERARAEARWRPAPTVRDVGGHAAVAARALPLQHAMGIDEPVPPAARPTTPAARATSLAYVHRVLNHAHAINEKIEQLNALWPNVVGAYEEAVARSASRRARRALHRRGEPGRVERREDHLVKPDSVLFTPRSSHLRVHVINLTSRRSRRHFVGTNPICAPRARCTALLDTTLTAIMRCPRHRISQPSPKRQRTGSRRCDWRRLIAARWPAPVLAAPTLNEAIVEVSESSYPVLKALKVEEFTAFSRSSAA